MSTPVANGKPARLLPVPAFDPDLLPEALRPWAVDIAERMQCPLDFVAVAAMVVIAAVVGRRITEAELIKLLDVARRRPLVDAMTVYKGPRKGEQYAKLRPEVQRRLERLGQERELIYETLVLTGLRKGELASLTVGQLVFDADPAFVVLDAADEKNREGNSIPLRADLAADLRQWLADKATAFQEATSNARTVHFDQEPTRARNATRAKPRDLLGTSCGCRLSLRSWRLMPQFSRCRPGWSRFLIGT